eukprot:scaffold59167_cov91-Phaeocystis_antarctica.AAC.1
MRKAPALPPGAHRHVPRALWLFGRKQECRHLIGLETGVQVAESHYLAKRCRMICSSITQLPFDFFRNSSPTTFEPANKRRLRCWPCRAGAHDTRPHEWLKLGTSAGAVDLQLMSDWKPRGLWSADSSFKSALL